jgi:hypothetical protein
LLFTSNACFGRKDDPDMLESCCGTHWDDELGEDPLIGTIRELDCYPICLILSGAQQEGIINAMGDIP